MAVLTMMLDGVVNQLSTGGHVVRVGGLEPRGSPPKTGLSYYVYILYIYMYIICILSVICICICIGLVVFARAWCHRAIAPKSCPTSWLKRLGSVRYIRRKIVTTVIGNK